MARRKDSQGRGLVKSVLMPAGSGSTITGVGRYMYLFHLARDDGSEDKSGDVYSTPPDGPKAGPMPIPALWLRGSKTRRDAAAACASFSPPDHSLVSCS